MGPYLAQFTISRVLTPILLLRVRCVLCDVTVCAVCAVCGCGVCVCWCVCCCVLLCVVVCVVVCSCVCGCVVVVVWWAPPWSLLALPISNLLHHLPDAIMCVTHAIKNTAYKKDTHAQIHKDI